MGTPLIRINGASVATPSKYSMTTSTIVDSGRNVAGYVVGNVVRQDVVKIELFWRYLTNTQWAIILNRFKDSFYVDVYFYNQNTHTHETRTMYCSDRSASAFHYDGTSVPGWTDCSLSLVEV